MANKLYNILWIDDEWDKMTTFQQECEELHGLHLEPFRTRKAGMEAYERNIEHWDAVLLDAKMFDEGENEVARLVGLRKAIQRLDELSIKRAVPRFISTGQTDLMSDENFKDSFGDFYRKGDDDVKLIDDILQAIENSERQQVRAYYHDVFSAIDSLGITEFAEDILLDILLPLHFPAKNPNFKPVYQYNQLRQLLEYLFRSCHKVGLVPDVCISDGRVNLNQCSLYLAGKDAEKLGIRYGEKGERVIPDYIENIIRSILDFGNIHSHTVELSEEDFRKIEKILNTAKSRFIVFGLALQICEVVMWFAEYITNHNDKEINLFYCNKLSSKEAEEDDINTRYLNKEFVPEKDEEGIWHCGECYVTIRYWDDSKMLIKSICPNTDSKTNKKYPYFAKYEKIHCKKVDMK